MTRLRFVGDLPLWLGLLLALLVALMAWRYYRRESFDLPHRLRWVLPALRSLAFFLGSMVLTGPVLHHRETIGELGRVRIYVDGSQSMGLLDRHVSPGRKLLIAEQQGWLEEGRVDSKLLDQANELAQGRVCPKHALLRSGRANPTTHPENCCQNWQGSQGHHLRSRRSATGATRSRPTNGLPRTPPPPRQTL